MRAALDRAESAAPVERSASPHGELPSPLAGEGAAERSEAAGEGFGGEWITERGMMRAAVEVCGPPGPRHGEFPSPLVGEGGTERGEVPGEGSFAVTIRA